LTWRAAATAASKLEDFMNLATLLHSGRIELSPDPTLHRDLLSIKKRTMQQGLSIVLPRTGDGRHCDTAPALCSALKRAAAGGPIEYKYTPAGPPLAGVAWKQAHRASTRSTPLRIGRTGLAYWGSDGAEFDADDDDD
jgi:hypothetical protein